MNTNDRYNELFDNEIKNHQKYIDGLEAQAQQYASSNPEKYKRAQATGNLIMDSNYDLKNGIDEEQELFTYDIIMQLINDYNMDINEMSKYEQDIYSKYQDIKK